MTASISAAGYEPVAEKLVGLLSARRQRSAEAGAPRSFFRRTRWQRLTPRAGMARHFGIRRGRRRQGKVVGEARPPTTGT